MVYYMMLTDESEDVEKVLGYDFNFLVPISTAEGMIWVTDSPKVEELEKDGKCKTYTWDEVEKMMMGGAFE